MESVWKTTCRELKFQGATGISLEHKAKAWWTEKSVRLYSAYPSLFSYGIWWARNTVIFNNKLIPPEINKGIPWDFFDGASQGDPPLGGSGEVLYLSGFHKIQAKFAPRNCTNNNAELAGLHMVLELAFKKTYLNCKSLGTPKWW